MQVIVTSFITHKLNIDPLVNPISQWRRPMSDENTLSIRVEVEKLVDANFLREIRLKICVVILVLIREPTDMWRICFDFMDLNKVSPKDSYPLS